MLFVAFVSEAFFGLKKKRRVDLSAVPKGRREYGLSSKIDCRGVIDIVRELRRFGKACFLPVKRCTRNSIASAQKKYTCCSSNKQKH